jgi:hypothetical protein
MGHGPLEKPVRQKTDFETITDIPEVRPIM